MKAIILNSGLGNRMGDLTKDKPKCLVALSQGETILSRQVDFLERNNIKEIIITTGPFEEMIKDYLNNLYGHKDDIKLTYIRNDLYDSTNYIYSLYLAKEAVIGSPQKEMAGLNSKNHNGEEEILLMHGDLVFTDAGPLKLLNSPVKDAVLVDSSPQIPEKDFKCRIKDGIITEIGVDVFGDDCRFLFPMYRLKLATYSKWLHAMEDFVAAGKTGVYAENALNKILETTPLRPVYYKDDFCAEVDDVEDLKTAIKMLY